MSSIAPKDEEEDEEDENEINDNNPKGPTPGDDIETIGGTGEGGVCQIPFNHKGEEHNMCIHDPEKGNGLFCITDAETGAWGFCKQPGKTW